MKHVLLSILILFTASSQAKSGLVDIEWKKIELEKLLSERIKNLLQQETFDGISHVDVRITLDKDRLKRHLEPKDAPRPELAKPSATVAISPIVKFDLENEAIEFRRNETNKVEEIDIYNFFKDITVDIYFDKEISPEKQKMVLSFVSKNFPSYSNVKLNYKAKVSMTVPKKKKSEFWDPRKQGYALYSLLAMLGVVALIFASRTLYKGFLSLADAFEKAMGRKDAKEETAKEVGLELPKGENKTHTKISFDKHEGVKKFKSLLSGLPRDASSLLKVWMNQENLETKSALYMVMRSLDVTELQRIFKQIPSKDRSKLKRSLKISFLEIDTNKGDEFLQDQISTVLLYRDKIKDEKLKELIVECEDKGIKKIIEKNISAGVYLLALLPPFQASRITAALDEETFVALMTSEVHEEIPETILNYLKETLESGQSEQKKLPMVLENIEEFLTNATPQREQSIFSLAAEYIDQEELSELCLKHFPTFLAQKLSTKGMYRVFSKLSVADKLKFLLLQTDEKRQDFLNLIGPVGSRARDVYEVDLDKWIADKEALLKVKNDTQRIWYTFTHATRKIILTDEELKREAHEVVSSWIQEQTKNNSGDMSSAA